MNSITEESSSSFSERYLPTWAPVSSMPLTMVMPKNDRIPMVTSGGLDTVGIRVPSHKVMHRIIELSGCAIAAPSANTSGYPSPTSAEHVMRDMNGKIAAVVDGGQSEFGVESTVISFDGDDAVRILRPGAITREMLLEVCGDVVIDPAILHEVEAGAKVASPGMKYKQRRRQSASGTLAFPASQRA